MFIEKNSKHYGNIQCPSGLTVINNLVFFPVFCSSFTSACSFKLVSSDALHSDSYNRLLQKPFF